MSENFKSLDTKHKYAWAVFKYFTKNKDLLLEEDNSTLYLHAKNIMINYYCNLNKTTNREVVEKVILWLADEENAHFPQELQLTEEIIDIILK